MEMLKLCMKFVLKVAVKTFEKFMELVLIYMFSLCYFTPIFRVSVFDFEQVSAVWVIEYLHIFS